MARALLIAPEDQSIESVEVNSIADIATLIGQDTLASDTVGNDGDRLYFDEECFIRGSVGRFQIDRLVPVAGKGVIVGVADDGATLVDVRTRPEDLRSRTVFQ